MKPDSLHLVQQARTGSATALEQLLERFLPELRSYIRLKCGVAVRNQESCSDLVQSVCREALRDLEQVQDRTEPAFKGWLFRVAEHKVLDRVRYYHRDRRDVRRERRMAPQNNDSEGELHKSYAHFLTPSRVAVTGEEMQRIEAAFDKIPERYREVILLARIAGLSYEELAQRLECSVHYARTLLSRALARLAAVLGPGFDKAAK